MRDDLLSWIKADIENCECGVHEFPVTTMTCALWSGIKLIAQMLDHPRVALDVGSGSGVHSFLLASLGVKKVYGLERCELAVSHAKDRANRFQEYSPGNWTLPRFILGCVEAVPSSNELPDQFDIMTMNPPAFFSSTELNISSPLDSGLYTSSQPTNDNPNPANPINDFFKLAVSQRLAPGGIAICTWPGIQTRQVTDGEDNALHPAKILMRRFNWKINGADVVSAKDFYRYRSKLTYNDLSLNEFRLDTNFFIEEGKYHPYVKRHDTEYQHEPTFTFGVLAIRRDMHVSDMFHLIDINLPT